MPARKFRDRAAFPALRCLTTPHPHTHQSHERSCKKSREWLRVRGLWVRVYVCVCFGGGGGPIRGTEIADRRFRKAYFNVG